MIKRILLQPNPQRARAEDVAAEVYQMLRKQGAEFFADETLADHFDRETEISFLPLRDAMAQSDLMLIVGGDGSILRFAGMAAQEALPILGVNLGHLGFLTELELDELALLNQVMAGSYELEERMMIDVKIMRAGEAVFEATGLNEAIVSKRQLMHTVGIQVFSDDVSIIQYDGDGVILCTPTGSTAYSMSAGGPIVEPSSHNLIVTPICPHTFNARAFVLTGDRVLRVRTQRYSNNQAYLSVDGAEGMLLTPADEVVIRRSAYLTRLVRVNNRNFSTLIDMKFSSRKRQD